MKYGCTYRVCDGGQAINPPTTLHGSTYPLLLFLLTLSCRSPSLPPPFPVVSFLRADFRFLRTRSTVRCRRYAILTLKSSNFVFFFAKCILVIARSISLSLSLSLLHLFYSLLPLPLPRLSLCFCHLFIRFDPILFHFLYYIYYYHFFFVLRYCTPLSQLVISTRSSRKAIHRCPDIRNKKKKQNRRKSPTSMSFIERKLSINVRRYACVLQTPVFDIKRNLLLCFGSESSTEPNVKRTRSGPEPAHFKNVSS